MFLTLAVAVLVSANPVKIVAPGWQFTGLERTQGEIYEAREPLLLAVRLAQLRLQQLDFSGELVDPRPQGQRLVLRLFQRRANVARASHHTTMPAHLDTHFVGWNGGISRGVSSGEPVFQNVLKAGFCAVL